MLQTVPLKKGAFCVMYFMNYKVHQYSLVMNNTSQSIYNNNKKALNVRINLELAPENG